jgi:transketolase
MFLLASLIGNSTFPGRKIHMHSERRTSLLAAANEARGLALDAVEAANSGHLGMPMGCAEIGAALFGELLNFVPDSPTWINRDRFVLSAGHGSMFLYTWLHLAGYKISITDIRNFRKSDSPTAGHPEFNQSIGIECTTGPLGQGIANAIGMAVSCKKQAVMLNTPNHKILNNHIVCLCGDGCLQEGIASEACSLAGHWKLDNFILIFDANGITIDGRLEQTQSENVVQKFLACNFEVFTTDGSDLDAFIKTFNQAKSSNLQCPKLIIAETIIGSGIDEIAGTSNAHGSAGIKFINEVKQRLGLPAEKFFISEATRNLFAARKAECEEKYAAWLEMFKEWQVENSHLVRHLSREVGSDTKFLESIGSSNIDKISTRAASGEILQIIAEHDDHILSGSADLFSSTGNYIRQGEDFSAENLRGRNIFFGIREHAMAAIANGISYDGTFRLICSTFLVFSDYMRAAIRVAALAGLETVFIFTHDSIAVGEDGPTHQPVETMAALRCIPNLDVIRPADYEEVVGGWELALENHGRPTALILSRQDLPLLREIPAVEKRSGTPKGAYIAVYETEKLERILIASGSELQIAVLAAALYNGTRVVSMPCMEAFERQSKAYKDLVLPKSCKNRIAIEAGVAMPWHRYVGSDGQIISVENFGYSGKAADLLSTFKITLENLKNTIELGQMV